MTTTTTFTDETPPPELFQLARDLERWRAKTRRGRRIPEDLWDAAARLAGTYGVSRISAVLKLSYSDLQRRAQGASSTPMQAPSTFVELPAPKGSTGLSCQGTIELVHACGARLMLRLPEAKAEDLWALLRAFLDSRP